MEGILNIIITLPLILLVSISMFVSQSFEKVSETTYKPLGGCYQVRLFQIYCKRIEGGLGIFSSTYYDKLDGADFASFSVVKTVDGDGSNYAKDKKHVYYGNQIVKKANPRTFVSYTSHYGKDTDHIYDGSHEITSQNRLNDTRNLDFLVTFKNRNIVFLGDSQNVYLYSGFGNTKYALLRKFDLIDVSTFTLNKNIDKTMGFENFILGEDEQFVHQFKLIDTFSKYYEYFPVPKNDLIEIEYIDKDYIRIENRLYLAGELVNDDYPAGSLRSLEKIIDNQQVISYYKKDNRNVYYKNNLVRDADFESFHVYVEKNINPNTKKLEGYKTDYAEDKNYLYYNGSIMDSTMPGSKSALSDVRNSYVAVIE